MSDKYIVSFSDRAEDELYGLVAYITDELKNPQAAKRIYRKIVSEAELLTEMPKRYQLVNAKQLAVLGFRRFVVEGYIVYYVVKQETREVDIARVLCRRRNWQSALFDGQV